jgi:hypothetical protein
MTGTDWNEDRPDAGVAGSFGQPGAVPADPADPAPAQFGPGGPAPAQFGTGGPETIELGGAGGAPASRGRKRVVVPAAAAAAVVIVAAIVLVVVRGGSTPQTPAQVLTAAAHKSADLSSLTATFSEQASGVNGGSVSATVKEIRKPLQMSMSMTELAGGQSISLSAVINSKAMYMKLGAAAGLPSSMAGKWLEIPLTGLDSGSFASLIESAESQNPVSQIQVLLAGKQLRADGTQVVDGVETTRYTGSITPSTALKMLPASSRTFLTPMLKEMQGNSHFTIWIDGSDQIRKVVENENVSGQPVTVTMTLGNFNQPLTITLPPASQVMKIPASALGGS